MIGYVCEAVILVAGGGFLALVLLQWRTGSWATTESVQLPAELLPTAAIDIVDRPVSGAHLAPAGRRRRGTRRTPVIAPHS
jgi:hypothetical protein